jgi:hypothetical protein
MRTVLDRNDVRIHNGITATFALPNQFFAIGLKHVIVCRSHPALHQKQRQRPDEKAVHQILPILNALEAKMRKNAQKWDL